MRKTQILWLVPACIALATGSSASVKTMSGGLSLGYDFSDRQYENQDETSEASESVSSVNSRDDDRSRFVVSPFVRIVSETPRHSAQIEYAPTFFYDVDESENDVNHKLLLDYNRSLTQRWTMSLSNNFINTDDYNSYSPTIDSTTGDIVSAKPGADAITGDSLNDTSGRRRYYTNVLNLGSSYLYFEDSTLGFNYSWSVLRNDETDEGSNYEDYDKHDVNVFIDHRINSRWKVVASAGYIKGLYDSVDSTEDDTESIESNDTNEYRGSLGVHHELSTHHSLSTTYAYSGSEYESDLETDSEIHDLTFGWGWLVSPKLTLDMGAGPTYSKQDGEDGTWDYNGNFSLNYRMQKGSVGVVASGGRSFDNFSGTGERGTTDYWQVQSNFSYTPYQYTTVSAYLAYRNEDSDQATTVTEDTVSLETITSDEYSAGCSLTYRFFEHYSADLSYGYVRLESDNAEDEYQDHRVQLTLSYENDFLQW
jgi:hypothetical protein